MKEGCLFIFCVYHIDISQTMTTLATLLVALERSQWVHMHGVGFIMLQTMVEKLLSVDQFSLLKIH